MTRKEARARTFAMDYHRGQFDDAGKAFFYAHIVPVINILKILTDDEETICAGYLHDILEDTTANLSQLRKIFGDDIARIVRELTHDGKPDSIGYYFPKLKSKKAIMVKFADRLSNMSRMENWDKERQEHYLKNSRFWKNDNTIRGSNPTQF